MIWFTDVADEGIDTFGFTSESKVLIGTPFSKTTATISTILSKFGFKPVVSTSKAINLSCAFLTSSLSANTS